MVLSEQEIDSYILDYYSHLIEDPKERERLVSKARLIVGRNLRTFGTYSVPRLHGTLSEVLDYGYNPQNRTASLNEDLNGDGWTRYNFIPSNSGAVQPVID